MRKERGRLFCVWGDACENAGRFACVPWMPRFSPSLFAAASLMLPGVSSVGWRENKKTASFRLGDSAFFLPPSFPSSPGSAAPELYVWAYVSRCPEFVHLFIIFFSVQLENQLHGLQQAAGQAGEYMKRLEQTNYALSVRVQAMGNSGPSDFMGGQRPPDVF